MSSVLTRPQTDQSVPLATAAERPDLSTPDLPFESPEFGMSGFFPDPDVEAPSDAT